MKARGLRVASLSVILSVVLAVVLAVAIHGSLSHRQSHEETPANRLSQESSPYLLLHAHNPVDWYPWGDEAIEKAREEDKPIFVSIGYSTCYWCHVMEREVFSNPEIAELMNQWFVNIKVDREERPDLDDIYMVATQLITRASGGWPNSVFLTPELKPFFAGTYFPPEDRGSLPGFPTILTRVREAWASQRPEVEASAERVSQAMRTIAAERRQPGELPSPTEADRAVADLKRRFDETNGGFSEAPKFPSPSNLLLLWDRAVARGDAEAGRMVIETLHKMGQGAIYDQLGGGFHRYTLDAQWRVPHFEKMLYDNAHLAELLAVTAQATGDPDLERLARGTLDFALREMRLDDGGFKSAIDAETDGEEGAYYVWTRDELRDVLSEDGYDLLAPIMGFVGPTNFEGEKYPLYLTDTLTEHAKRLGWTRSDLLDRMDSQFDRLRQARAGREFPLVDDKVLTDWNGMMIAALARAGLSLDEPRYLRAAERAADFLLANLKDSSGDLFHSWREGDAKIPAFLDDYAFLMKGLLALYEATGEDRWLGEAERLAEEMERRLRDRVGGYYLSEAKPHLLFQPKTIYDGAIPSGNGVATLALLDLAEHTGKVLYRQRAEATMKAFADELAERPGALRTLAQAVDRYHRTHSVVSSPPTPAQVSGSGATEPTVPLAEELVTTQFSFEDVTTDEATWRAFQLRVTIRAGWHVNANPASLPYLIPTEVQGDVRNVRYPEGEEFEFAFSDESLSVLSGTISIGGEIDRNESTLRLVYQACDDRRCLAPVDKTIEVASTN